MLNLQDRRNITSAGGLLGSDGNIYYIIFITEIYSS